jgi:hypothetical protein
MDTRRNVTEGNGTRCKVMGHFFVNALHAFHRFNRRYHVKNANLIRGWNYGPLVVETSVQTIMPSTFKCKNA